jgi:hypothetical protein
MSYVAPLKDMLFVMNELADLAAINALPGCEDATPETVEAVLEENARFCGEVIAPRVEGRQGHNHAGFQGGVQGLCRGWLARRTASN